MSRLSKRDIIEQRIKSVRKLEKELDTIYEAQSKLGYFILDKPIKNGWYRTFKLRADILRSEKHKVYQEVLNAVVVEIRGSNKKNANKRWIDYFQNTFKNFPRPGIRRLNKKEYTALSAQAQKCFVARKYSTCNGYKVKYSCLLPRYYFQISYRRAYITKYKLSSSALESRGQEISEILNKACLRKYSGYYNYQYRHYYNPTKKERRKTKMVLLARRYEINVPSNPCAVC